MAPPQRGHGSPSRNAAIRCRRVRWWSAPRPLWVVVPRQRWWLLMVPV
jgi:hypothetical protein